jgi:hypothetical protein
MKRDGQRRPIRERNDGELVRLVERDPRDLEQRAVLDGRRRIVEKPADGELDWR